MAIKKLQEWDESLGRYASENDPTTQQQIISFLQNNNEVLQALAGILWQPSKAIQAGMLVWSPNMLANTVAICKTVGITATSEPTWANAGSTIVDGSVIYEVANWSFDSGEIESAIQTKEDAGTCVPRTNNTASTIPANTSPTQVLTIDSFENGGTVKYTTLANLFAKLTKAQIVTALGYTPPTSSIVWDSTISLTASTQKAITPSVKGLTTSQGFNTFTTDGTSIKAGSYKLKTILQYLVNNSHRHTAKSVTGSNCDCNCNCNCNCGDTDGA